jgi:hypothetical protein
VPFRTWGERRCQSPLVELIEARLLTFQGDRLAGDEEVVQARGDFQRVAVGDDEVRQLPAPALNP